MFSLNVVCKFIATILDLLLHVLTCFFLGSREKTIRANAIGQTCVSTNHVTLFFFRHRELS